MPPRRQSARTQTGQPEKLIIAAERLIGEFGLEGVSFRQIGAAAGAANHFAVQYHFGNKDGLVNAIFAYRLPWLEARRAELLTAIAQSGRLNEPRALVEVIFRPVAELIDLNGRRTWARFLARMQRQGEISYWNTPNDLAPVTRHVAEVLQGVMQPAVPAHWCRRRMGYATMLFLTAVVDMEDRETAGNHETISEEAILVDALDTATAALLTPVSAQLRTEIDAAASG